MARSRSLAELAHDTGHPEHDGNWMALRKAIIAELAELHPDRTGGVFAGADQKERYLLLTTALRELAVVAAQAVAAGEAEDPEGLLFEQWIRASVANLRATERETKPKRRRRWAMPRRLRIRWTFGRVAFIILGLASAAMILLLRASDDRASILVTRIAWAFAVIAPAGLAGIWLRTWADEWQTSRLAREGGATGVLAELVASLHIEERKPPRFSQREFRRAVSRRRLPWFSWILIGRSMSPRPAAALTDVLINRLLNRRVIRVSPLVINEISYDLASGGPSAGRRRSPADVATGRSTAP